ncbi:MAG: hypothetical protein KBS94_08165 [Prevotella sp.]|nr:hypothetical protein [Candidatus Equicola faecalis]
MNRIDPDGNFDFENIDKWTIASVVAVFQTTRDKALNDDYEVAQKEHIPIITVDNTEDLNNALKELNNIDFNYDVLSINSHGNYEGFMIGEDKITLSTDLSSLKENVDGKTIFVGACDVGQNGILVSQMAEDLNTTVVAAQHKIPVGYKYDGSNNLNYQSENMYILNPQILETYNSYSISTCGSCSTKISNVTIDKYFGIHWDSILNGKIIWK